MTSTTRTRRRYRVNLAGKPIRLGGLGMAATSYAAFNGEADSVADAIEQARANAREKMPSYADGRATVAVLHQYAITLRGRDKRKRETFITVAADEREALRQLQHKPAVYKHAGGSSIYRPGDPRIIRIEVVG